MDSSDICPATYCTDCTRHNWYFYRSDQVRLASNSTAVISFEECLESPISILCVWKPENNKIYFFFIVIPE